MKNLFLYFLLFFSEAFALAKAPLYLGFLEYNEANRAYVRVAFKNETGIWEACVPEVTVQKGLQHAHTLFPSSVLWTVAFDGKKLGQVQSIAPQKYGLYSEIGLLPLMPNPSIPKIGKASLEFGDWSAEMRLRPLAAVSESHFSDPEQWKPKNINRDTLRSVRADFRHMFPQAKTCNQKGQGMVSLSYQDQDILVRKSYTNRLGVQLASLELRPFLDKCGLPNDDEEDGFGVRWFSISKDNKVKYLGSQMMFLDAGDYDGDGKSELVFKVRRDNYDGYALWAAGLEKLVEFGWVYQ